MSKSTKSKFKALVRRKLRHKENKLTNVTRSKMLGTFCRYMYGGGKVSTK